MKPMEQVNFRLANADKVGAGFSKEEEQMIRLGAGIMEDILKTRIKEFEARRPQEVLVGDVMLQERGFNGEFWLTRKSNGEGFALSDPEGIAKKELVDLIETYFKKYM